MSSSFIPNNHSIDVDDYDFDKPRDVASRSDTSSRSGKKKSARREEQEEATFRDEEEDDESVASTVIRGHRTPSKNGPTVGGIGDQRFDVSSSRLSAQAREVLEASRASMREKRSPMEMDYHPRSSIHSSNSQYESREIFMDEGDEDDEDKELNCRNCWGWVWCFFWLFIIGLTIGVSCRQHGCNASSDPVEVEITRAPVMRPTSAPVSAPVPFFTPAPTPKPDLTQQATIDGLPPFTMQALKDSASPQAQAYRWVAEDPLLAEYNNKRRIQRFALATLYYATNGANWKDQHWLKYEADAGECTWFTRPDSRVYPEYETQYNTSPCSSDFEYMFLTPWDNGMSGTLPPELGLLTKLQILDLTGGEIGGTIPTELGLLTNMRKMWLSALQLTGTIPTAFFALTNLVGLGLYMNKLSGQVPSEIGLLTNLELVELYRNEFVGPLPSEIGLLPSLVDFQIDNNKLDAFIPTELGLAKSLSSFIAYENKFQGPIPSEFGQLKGLTKLILSDNYLSSALPLQLQRLESLQELLVARNFIEGRVSNFTFASTILKFLHLEGNNLLVGTFPRYLCLLQGGLQFDCNPPQLCGCQCACQNNTGITGGGR